MCGICGIWGTADTSLVNDMMKGIIHRGPDDSGVFSGKKGTLGHRRLSIMDPESGKQPIYNEDRTSVVLANGEIYNFPSLKKPLADSHHFSTGNDSEVLLHLFEDFGPSMTNRLDGMYAFCLTDGEDVFLARDPVGIKPLYYSEKIDGTLVFSSELKNFYPSSAERIHEFPPGTWYHSRKGFVSYHDFKPAGILEQKIGDYSASLRKSLEAAVNKRLMSDVPLGCFLSGGLDSSIISALASQQINDMHTFSVGLEGSRDLPAAELVARHIGTQHHAYILSISEVMAELPKIIYHLESFDQDLVRSAIPCHFTSRIASDHVKVILTGEGADELFGGYTYYKDIVKQEELQEELLRSVKSLHNLNLQRVDRLTMAHSIEGRVPFLDLDMIELAGRIPSDLKIDKKNHIEKWILRKSVEDLLPAEIVWRKKEQFDEGSGIAESMSSAVKERFSRRDAQDHRKKYPNIKLRSLEELYYHKLFTEIFPNAGQICDNVGRWSVRPEFSKG